MPVFFKSLFLLTVPFLSIQVQAAEAEHEILVQGTGRSKSESESRTEALDQCRKGLTVAKNTCTDRKGSFREVACGVRCTDLTTLWDCRATGSGFCHGHQAPL